MSKVGQIERITQNRVVQLFQKQLGYTYLGNWEERPNNKNIEEALLRPFLSDSGYSPTLVNKAIFELSQVANQRAPHRWPCMSLQRPLERLASSPCLVQRKPKLMPSLS